MRMILADESVKFNKYDSSITCYLEKKENDVFTSFVDKKIQLVAGKNDTVAFQVVLEADSNGYILMSGNSPFLSVDGNFEIRRVETTVKCNFEVEQKIVGFIRGDKGKDWADIILNEDNRLLDRYETGLIYVEIKIPKECEAGVYSGKVRLFSRDRFSDEKPEGEIDFDFEVLDTVIPDCEDFKFYLDLWQHNFCMSRHHEVIPFSEQHFEILEKYTETLGKVGQKAITIVASDAPWLSQDSFTNREYLNDFFEYSYINVTKNLDSEIICDFKNLDRYINLCAKYGILEEIEIFGLLNVRMNEKYGYGNITDDYIEPIRIRYYDEPTNCFKYLKSAIDIESYICQIYLHFVSNKLIDKVRILADEPLDLIDFKKRLDKIRSIAPGFKYKLAVASMDMLKFISSEMDDIVPLVNSFFEDKSVVDSIIKKYPDKRVHYYVACIPTHPNTFIESPLIESRLLPVFANYLGVRGLLRWAYTEWTKLPRTNLSSTFPSGEGCFVYPSTSGGPLLSLRYKNLLRGIIDFELLSNVTEEIRSQYFEMIIRENDISIYLTVEDRYKNKGKIYSVDYDDYTRAKRLLLTNQMVKEGEK